MPVGLFSMLVCCLALLLPAVAVADAIIRTQVMLATTIVEYFVEDQGVYVELEIGLADVEAFRNLRILDLPRLLSLEIDVEDDALSRSRRRGVRSRFERELADLLSRSGPGGRRQQFSREDAGAQLSLTVFKPREYDRRGGIGDTMPNVIWSSTSKVKDGRGAEAVTRALKLKQVFVDAGAISARYFNSTAGPNAPSSTFAVEFRSLAHMEEVFAKFGQDAWAQEAYFSNTDQPSTQVAQGLLFEVE